MPACCTKMPGYYAALGLHMAIAFAFAGLLSSTGNMYIFLQQPVCAAGTTKNFDARTPSQPFCSEDVLSSSVFIQFDKIGFSSMTHSGFLAKSGIEAGSGVDFCLTGDCDALGIDNGKIAVMSVSQSDGVSLLRVNASDLVDFTKKKLTGIASSVFVDQYNGRTMLDFSNLPVSFYPATGFSLPSGLSEGTIYYLRPMPSVGYAVATSTSALPLASIASVSTPSTFSFYSKILHGDCPNQASKVASATIAIDGSLKDSVCGYCLNKNQRIGILTVPGAAGAAIALMLLLAIAMMIPAARKGTWFKCVTLSIAFFSIVLLIAAISLGYVIMASVLGCAYGASAITTSDNLKDQFTPVA